jgi:hypothetical protein
VRTKHAARLRLNGEFETLWGDIRTADQGFFEVAVAQRRGQIVGECKQLRLDVESFNENANPDVPVQLCLDFTDDVDELLMAVPAN